MTHGVEPADVASCFLAACRGELTALKPGNVHVFAAGHGMEVAQFERAAEAAAPFIADRRLSVGARVLAATAASMTAAGCNTNLGILLLTAPLAAAAEDAGGGTLRQRLARVLAKLDHRDAEDVFAAIRTANPGGLGRVAKDDVTLPPSVSLRDAMELAADRDRIARAYVTDFDDLFTMSLPALAKARQHAVDENWAVTTLHMRLLARFADSHIGRKSGADAAEDVRRRAHALAATIEPAAGPQDAEKLLIFDKALKAEGRNPGTTADFVAATLFAAALAARLAPPTAR